MPVNRIAVDLLPASAAPGSHRNRLRQGRGAFLLSLLLIQPRRRYTSKLANQKSIFSHLLKCGGQIFKARELRLRTSFYICMSIL